MTAIAYDGKLLAADSLITNGGVKTGRVDKVEVINHVSVGIFLISTCGKMIDGEKFVEYARHKLGIKNTEKLPSVFNGDENFPKLEEDFTAIIVLPDGRWMKFWNNGTPGIQSGPVTLGSAWEFLYGAMDAGVTASEAVLLACNRLTDCGGPVKAYKPGVGLVS